MILRKPFGFALIYTLLVGVMGALLVHLNLTLPIIPFAGLAFLLVYTLIYILFVKAHLSHHFRIYSALFIALLGIAAHAVHALLDHSIDLMAVFMNPYTWLNALVNFIVTYLVISLANWIAGFFFKGKGHI